MDTYVTVVLAAGQGTRMHSALPKVLHQLAGVPLLSHVLKSVEALSFTSTFSSLNGTLSAHRPVVVLGHEAAQVRGVIGDRCLYAMQDERLGPGDAVLSAQSAVDILDPLPQTVLVCYGDTPLVRSEVLARVLVEHVMKRATVTFLTACTERPSDFGRIVRDASGGVCEIIEMKRATQEQQGIKEINSGMYCFDRAWLWPTLRTLPRNPTGEYYLTDLIQIAHAQERVIVTVEGTLDETIGVNDRVQLAEAEQLLRHRVLERHMYTGVTIIDPATTYIDDDVHIGRDTVIFPATLIRGKTTIGCECRIGPGTTIEQSTLGNGCIVQNSVVEEATFEDNVRIGPFSHCRPGTYLARGVSMGNFAEVKNSSIGAQTDIHHFSYIGDATVGAHVNIGAGTITSNYNGLTKEKYHTTIENGAFIGCDTILIPPVTVGAHAQTGAGSVVNRDVPSNALVIGIPARLLRMLQPPENSATEHSEKG